MDKFQVYFLFYILKLLH